MKYFDSNQEIHVGDGVLYAGVPADIVFVIDDDIYSARYTKECWSYLGKGLGLELRDETKTLYHLDASGEDLEPVSPLGNQTLPAPNG
jgi:hypothetical protein